ncbi:MAG TPA: elongation factor G [Egibacteraceae bacterium]|nr:elongation factor G [Egibacteraceae bacterium]
MGGNAPTPTDRIRNVLLVGHGGTGKTTLAETMMATAGTDVRGGLFDFEPEERDKGHSMSLAVASFEWRGHKVNLLDCPGSADFLGDAFPALRAADVALFVVDATAGVQAQHDQLWEACEAIGLPRIVFVNKLDKDNAHYQPILDALRERAGKAVAPVLMPVAGGELSGVIDLLHFTAVQKVDGQRVESEVPPGMEEVARRNRDALVEAIVEVDDALLERYLEGEIPEPKELAECFAHGVATSSFFPVLCGSATQAIGHRLLMDFIVEECPPPAAEPGGPLALYVAKTLSDPFVGRINVLKVLSGTLRQDAHAIDARTGADLRLHQLFALQGKEQAPVTEVSAGDLVAVAKLDDVCTGDVLAEKGASAEVERVAPPEPFHRVALEPTSAGDEDKLSSALARIAEEDPSLRVERDAETHQLVLRTYGPGHVELTLARMQRKFGVSVRQVPLRLRYRETLRGAATGVGRHVKQSGGHGQYGVCTIEVEPLPRGEGFVFADRIVGGVIPGTYIPSVEKGVRDTMAHGVLAGYPVVDVKVTLVDGKTHSVDSSDMAFQMAGSLAFRDAADKAGMCLLEPVMEVGVVIPDALTGDVMGDLSSRRGRILGTEPAGPGRTTVRAQVPEAELTSYVAELRSLSSGSGSVTLRYDHHAEVPDNIARKIVEAASAAT